MQSAGQLAGSLDPDGKFYSEEKQLLAGESVSPF